LIMKSSNPILPLCIFGVSLNGGVDIEVIVKVSKDITIGFYVFETIEL
jgi:hypothetical protein